MAFWVFRKELQSSDVLRRTDSGKECFIRDYLELLKLDADKIWGVIFFN